MYNLTCVKSSDPVKYEYLMKRFRLNQLPLEDLGALNPLLVHIFSLLVHHSL